jgi:hypothetical protein
VLRRIFGPKRDEMKGGWRKVYGWRKLYVEEFRNLYFSPSIFGLMKPRRMRWAGNVARRRETRDTYRLLVGNSEENRPL